MKTVIILSGLMLIVPQADPATGKWTALTVLVLNTAGGGFQAGEPVREHVNEVVNVNGTGQASLTGRWLVKAEGGTGEITVENRDRLLFLDDVYRDAAGMSLPPVRPECLRPDFATSCQANGHPLLVAQVRVEGTWKIRPVEVGRDRNSRADLLDDSTWGFLRLAPGMLPRATRHQIQLSSGLVLESGGPVKIQDPQATSLFSALAPSPPSTCGLRAGVPAKCAIVKFFNALDPKDCQLISSERLEIDHHHGILYDLFSPVPVPRYLLFLRKDGSKGVMNKLYPQGGGSVGCRPCVPPGFSNPVAGS